MPTIANPKCCNPICPTAPTEGASACAASVRDKIAEIAAEDSPTDTLTRAWTVPVTRPLVTCELLVSSSTVTFAEFLRFPQTKELFGSGDTGVLLEELLKAREFHYFGIAAGKFRKHKTRTRKTLTNT